MKFTEKYDRMITGILSGIILPLITGLIIFAFTAHGKTLGQYLSRITDANIITHAVTICVFTNIIIFLIYNRLDMLRAVRGVLAVTIVWAVTVFIIKVL